MAEQTDLLEGLEPDPAPRATAEAAEGGPEWAELAIGQRRYRWRLDTEAIDRTRWSPEDRVWPHREDEGPYKPPGPAFDLEYLAPDGAWRTVRYFNRRVEAWGMVREEALETYSGSE